MTSQLTNAAVIYFWLVSLFCSLIPTITLAQNGIHRAPIVIPGYQIRAATRYPISSYQLFKSNAQGQAETIPFQIDEINEWGDYVLDQGEAITRDTGNGIFDLQDELAFMGDDVGVVQHPKSFPEGKEPTLLFEIRLGFPQSYGAELPSKEDKTQGAVYLGLYFRDRPKSSERSYVQFNPSQHEVRTSRYRYAFDTQNYLVVRGVDMLKKSQDTKSTAVEQVPMVSTSTFYMKADLKYFVTVSANHRTMNSKIEAYKVGPVRSIVRVSFYYSFLKLKFELGMYTEISFFSNAVHLPAILFNPIDGPSSLNAGSGFYYGFNFLQKPSDYRMDTNMPSYKPASLLDRFRSPLSKSLDQYWVSMTDQDRMLYVEVQPSPEMLQKGSIPQLYVENSPPEQIAKRSNEQALPLSKSPVNLGLFFDLTKITKGEHRMVIRLYFENYFSDEVLENVKSLSKWKIETRRL